MKINNLNEKISYVNKLYIEEIYDLFILNGYGIYNISLLNSRLKIKNVKIIFEKNNEKSSSSFNEDNVSLDIDDYMVGAIFNFSNFKDLKIEISHEIGHAQEKYDKLLKNKLYNKNTISTHNIINYVIQKLRGDNKYFDALLDILYRTTDNELNNLHNEIYVYLKSFNIQDKNILLEKLKLYQPYETLMEIKDLDFKKLSYSILNNCGLDETSNIIDKFNTEYFTLLKDRNVRNIKTYNYLIDKKINSNQIIYYYENWKNIILIKLKKFENKLNDDINKVIFDLHKNETFVHIDYDKIYNYDDFCDDKLLLRKEKLSRLI